MVEPSKLNFTKQVGKYYISDKVLVSNNFQTVSIGCLVESKRNQVLVRTLTKSELDKNDIKKFVQILQINILFSSKLQHPNLVKIIDLIQTQTKIYVIEEFCNGGNLADYLKKKGGYLSEKESIIIFIELVKGIQWLNGKNLMHSDLRPENIMIHSDYIKISGWGMLDIKIPFFEKNEKYRSPQIINQEAYSQKCDIWSLGVLLFQMLYGVYPQIKTKEEILDVLKKKKNDITEVKFPDKPARSQNIKKLLINLLVIKEEKRISLNEILQNEIFSVNPYEIAKMSETMQKKNDEFLKAIWLNKLYLDKRKVIHNIQLSDLDSSKISLTPPMVHEIKENDSITPMIIERKNIKYAKRLNDYLLFERNLSMFYNNFTFQLFLISQNKALLNFPNDIYHRLLFLTSKHALLLMEKVYNALLGKIQIIPKKPDIWNYYATTDYHANMKTLVEVDLDKLSILFIEIEKKLQGEIEISGKKEKTTFAAKNYFEFLEKLDKLEALETIRKEIKEIEKELPTLFEKQIETMSREGLIINKFIMIAAHPYKFFKWNSKDYSAEVDFEKFYEELENTDNHNLKKDVIKNWIV